MTTPAAQQGTLFDLPGTGPAVRLDAIVPGVVLTVPAGADRARPRAYTLEVIKAGPGIPVDGAAMVHVRGRAPRQPGAIGRRPPFWAMLRLDLLQIAAAGPGQPAWTVTRPGDRSPEGEWSLPLPGPGRWSVTTHPCPRCGTCGTVRAQFGEQASNPAWACQACGTSGPVARTQQPASPGQRSRRQAH